jgi:hypothetical protein
MTSINEPYPNIGHVLNKLADIADTKSLAKKGTSRYRKEEDFSSRKATDPALLAESVRHLFHQPISEVTSDGFAQFFSDSIWFGLNNYIEIMKRVPMEGIAQSKVVGMLNKHLVVETLASIIWKVGINQMPNITVPSFYCDKEPIKALIAFYESQSTEQQNDIRRVFADNIRTANKWRSGEEIPNIGHISLLAHWASLSSPEAIDEDRETLFLTRFIASFHKKTKFKFVDALKKAVVWRLEHNQEPTLDLGNIFHQFYIQEITSSNLYNLSAEGNHLHQLLKRTTNKPPGSFNEYSSNLKALEASIVKHELKEELHYHSYWLWGRIYILSGQIEKALDMYVQAVESALYKSGNNIRDLLKEALAIAAIQTKPHKPTMKKIKSRALTFYPKIIEPHLRETPVRISQEDIDDWRFWFVMRFPQSGWFEEGQKPLMEQLQQLGLGEMAAKCF